MTTIVNNPQPVEKSNGLMSLIITFIVMLVLAYLLFIYGIPAIRQIQFGSPQINIPSKIDVNVNQTK